MISTPVRRGAAATGGASFPVSRRSPRAARSFVAGWLRDWDCPDVAEVALLLVSELVTNAVTHARTPTHVEVGRFGHTVRVAVSDGVPAGIDPGAGRHSGRPGAPSGRGLRIVEAMAERWGVTVGDLGKTVWFELRVPVGDGEPRDVGQDQG